LFDGRSLLEAGVMKKVLYLLGQLDDRDVEWLLDHGVKQHLNPGKHLIDEGKPLDFLYVVLDGTLDVFVSTLGPRPVDRMSCGDVAGEMSFIDARPPSATVRAVDSVTVLAVPRTEISLRLEREPLFAARFYRSIAMFLSQRLRVRNRPAHSPQGLTPSNASEQADELDANVLDTMHLAGNRFDRVLQRLLTS
jgi:CRP/FNR family cyclic AMP-dependent transcriptional regulator